MTAVNLSATVICYNEEDMIFDCLKSLDFADEIVVIDSYSTDATPDICCQFPKVRFFQHAFDGHIEQKNRAIDYAQGKWILSIDADERVSPELQCEMIEWLQKTPLVHGAKFPRLTKHLGKDIRHGGWYPNARYRLFRKGHASWGGENPHDQIFLQGQGVSLKSDLIHHSFQDLADHAKTCNAFSSISALEKFNRGKNYSLFRMLVKPPIKFLEMYLLKHGFLDGTAGLIVAITSAYASFLREAKLFELDRLQLNKPSNLQAVRYRNQRNITNEKT